MITWPGVRPLVVERPAGFGWIRLAWRLLVVLAVAGLLLPPLLIARQLDFEGMRRRIVKLACRLALRVLGLAMTVRGTPMRREGGLVANHCCWLDVVVLNAAQHAYFVSKSEVRSWPFCGVIARAAGTVFIRRRAMDALLQKLIFLDRIRDGHTLLFFPEGTSTDGLRVLPFRSSLFSAFFDADVCDRMWIQPVSLVYTAPERKRVDFYGWWANASFMGHCAMILSAPRQGSVELVFHEPLRVADYPDRKRLAKACQGRVSSAVNSAAIPSE